MITAGIWPKISLVTPSYNQGRYLAETIESVLAQNYPNLEYFVFDGGSSDDSVQVVRRYADRLTHWESKADKGQADAIAKGFALANGDVCNWLNSDDMLAPGALHRIAEMYQRDPTAGIYAAAVENFHDGRFEQHREKSLPQNFDLDSMFFRSGRRIHRHQPGIFMAGRLLREVGGVRSRYHYCMDVDIHARLLAAGARVVYDERTVAYFRLHPAAKTSGVSANTARTVAEYIEISDEVGTLVGLRPRHWAGHGRTLLAVVRHALVERDGRLLRDALRLLFRARFR